MNLNNITVEERFDLITEALNTEPRNWTKKHVQVLPKKFLLQNISTFTLTKIWEDLPENIKDDEEIRSHLPCLEHYNRDDDTIHIDGPPPSKSRCRGCIRERNLKKDTTRISSSNGNSSDSSDDGSISTNRTEMSSG